MFPMIRNRKGQHPMMASTRRREREVVAVAFNQKEQRVLEKSLATIRLEASYSLKLLDLHNRSVKVHFRQMKDKVSRIKSHLEPDEINELRQLEAEGKLEPMYTPVSLGSALKIAAAARRLHSSHGKGHPRAKSALPRFNLPDQNRPANGGLAPPPGVLKRSNSVTGVFIDVPPPRGGSRPGSAGLALGISSLSPAMTVEGVHRAPNGQASVSVIGRTADSRSASAKTAESKQSGSKLSVANGLGRPGSRGVRPSSNHLQVQQNGLSSSSSMDSQHSKVSASPAQHKPAPEPQQSKRPGSYMMVNGHRPSDATKSRKTSASTTSHTRTTTSHSHSHAPFSSHVATEKEAREREENGREVGGGAMTTPRSHYTSTERNSSYLGLQDDMVDDLGEDLFAERRAELLEEEQYRASVISRRKDRFLQDIDQYLRDHPPLTALPKPVPTKTKNQEDGERGLGEGVDAMTSALFRRRRVEFNINPTCLPEADYRERLMGLWRDMNKCRYLRVPDDMIDLSGINTLATDTMKLFQVLRHRQAEPLSNAWTE